MNYFTYPRALIAEEYRLYKENLMIGTPLFSCPVYGYNNLQLQCAYDVATGLLACLYQDLS